MIVLRVIVSLALVLFTAVILLEIRDDEEADGETKVGLCLMVATFILSIFCMWEGR